MSDEDRERKKEYMIDYYYKRKKMLHPLIDCDEGLENVSLK